MIALLLVALLCAGTALWFWRRMATDPRAPMGAGISGLLALLFFVIAVASMLSSRPTKAEAIPPIAVATRAHYESADNWKSLVTPKPDANDALSTPLTSWTESVPENYGPIWAFTDEDYLQTYDQTLMIRGNQAAEDFAQGQDTIDLAGAGKLQIRKADSFDRGDGVVDLCRVVIVDQDETRWANCGTLEGFHTQ